MRIYNSEKFLKRRLLEEPSYTYYAYQKAKEHPLKEREVFCFMVRVFCRLLFMGKKITDPRVANYFKKTVHKDKDGWYSVDKPFGQGRFINANKLFKNVKCGEAECHTCAYYFVLEAPVKSKLVFGSINPFRINNGLFHSICTFKLYDKEYVFDGANYMVMDKDLYYRTFNFMELQKISQEELIKDKEILSAKPILKNAGSYKFANIDVLSKRFYGIGFLTYLYNRDDFLQNNHKQCENFKSVVEDYSAFREKLERLDEKYSTAVLTLSEILSPNQEDKLEK